MKKAIFIIGHGSSQKDWIQLVEQEIKKVSSPFPIVLSFLEKVEGRSMKDGLADLKELKAKQILVIPLFVSSASTHIEEIKEILTSASDKLKVDFIYSDCMDDDDLVIDHIIQEVSIMSEDQNIGGQGVASHQAHLDLLLIAHGSDEPVYHERWESILQNIVGKLKSKIHTNRLDYATFLPHTIEEKLMEIIKDETEDLIIVPLFLSQGIFTDKKIPEILKNFNVSYRGNAYLNNGWINKWIQEKIDTFQTL